MKVCPVCGSNQLHVLVPMPGGDMVECQGCGARIEYERLDDR